MVAAPETCISAPAVTSAAGIPAARVRRRRAVAVAVSAMELLRPSSDLARLAESFDEFDLLVAAADRSTAAPGAVGVLGSTVAVRIEDLADDEGDDGEDADLEDDDDDDAIDDIDEVADGVARLGLPQLHLHRLGLPAPLDPAAGSDLVAAMSELVGFDPEPGVYCLAPAAFPPDPAREVVIAAAQRIARVYGVPLLRYRCMELSVVAESSA
ncbi:hypothetical protein [Pseudonocardia sp. GCM10023141]|uniref:hypothetical protein n=1 Tax=Pseudonocardia sp. GCM10023141 TaxID=3252653 RepID=UPI00360D96B3